MIFELCVVVVVVHFAKCVPFGGANVSPAVMPPCLLPARSPSSMLAKCGLDQDQRYSKVTPPAISISMLLTRASNSSGDYLFVKALMSEALDYFRC